MFESTILQSISHFRSGFLELFSDIVYSTQGQKREKENFCCVNDDQIAVLFDHTIRYSVLNNAKSVRFVCSQLYSSLNNARIRTIINAFACGCFLCVEVSSCRALPLQTQSVPVSSQQVSQLPHANVVHIELVLCL